MLRPCGASTITWSRVVSWQWTTIRSIRESVQDTGATG